LLIFPEPAICGYPPEDLLHKKHFLEDCRETVEQLAADCPKGTIIAGFADNYEGDGSTCSPQGCYNCVAILHAKRDD
jgi:NAD+ synthase (glutamine-hydrolysing)